MESSGLDLPVCAVILAAGDSKRFGAENKLLASVDGVAILERVVKAVIRSGVEKTIVVTGADHEAITSLLSGYDLELVPNKKWSEGIGTSLAIGAKAIDEAVYLGILVCLGDLAYLCVESVIKVFEAFYLNDGSLIVVPENDGRRGHPIIFPVNFHSELMELSGDQGAKAILNGARGKLMPVQVDSVGIYKDIDTRSDLDSDAT